MNQIRIHPGLHWPTFWRTMLVEAVGVLTLAVFFAGGMRGFDVSASLFAGCLANAVPWFIAGWLVFGLVFLVGLRLRPRFVSIRWCALAWIRLLLVIGSFRAAYPPAMALPSEWETSFVPLGALVLAVISSLTYTQLHRRARSRGGLQTSVRPQSQAIGLIAVGEFALVASLVIMGHGYDAAAWLVAIRMLGVWLTTWLAFLLWVKRRQRSGQVMTRVHFKLACFLRAWIGISVYLNAFVGQLDYASWPLDWWLDLVLPLAFCAIAGAAFCALPSIIYVRLTGETRIDKAAAARLRGGLSFSACIAAAGVELMLIILSNWRYWEYLQDGRDDVVIFDQLVIALILLPVLTWVLVRMPVLIWKSGWKAIGRRRFVLVSMLVSFLVAIGFHFLFGPQEVSIEWLLVMTSFGLVSGLAYILDCKLRADELLPS